KGSTVCCNEKVCIFKIRGAYRHQLYLHRPLAKLACHRRSSLGSLCLTLYRFCFGAWAALECWFLSFCRKDGGLVISRSFSLFKGYCACGAGGKAVAKSIAVIFAAKLCLSIYHFNCPLMAGIDAEPSAVTFFFVDFYG